MNNTLGFHSTPGPSRRAPIRKPRRRRSSAATNQLPSQLLVATPTPATKPFNIHTAVTFRESNAVLGHVVPNPVITASTRQSELQLQDAVIQLRTVSEQQRDYKIQVDDLLRQLGDVHQKITGLQQVVKVAQNPSSALLSTRVEQLEENVLSKNAPSVHTPDSLFVFATATRAVPVYSQPDTASMVHNMEVHIEQAEQVLLIYPHTLDATDCMWVQCRRVFDQGTIETYWVPFFDRQKNIAYFNEFTFSNASGSLDTRKK